MTVSEPSAGGDLPPYAVLAVHTDPAVAAGGHHHVVAVETTDPDGGETHWTLMQVISAILDGERFLIGEPTGQRGELEPAVCPRCHLATLVVAEPASAS